jgi:hypothetical protein
MASVQTALLDQRRRRVNYGESVRVMVVQIAMIAYGDCMMVSDTGH